MTKRKIAMNPALGMPYTPHKSATGDVYAEFAKSLSEQVKDASIPAPSVELQDHAASPPGYRQREAVARYVRSLGGYQLSHEPQPDHQHPGDDATPAADGQRPGDGSGDRSLGYEIAGYVFELARGTGVDGGYCMWGPPQFSFVAPSVPEGSIRNLRIVYYLVMS